jgi:hypothetical protein
MSYGKYYKITNKMDQDTHEITNGRMRPDGFKSDLATWLLDGDIDLDF